MRCGDAVLLPAPGGPIKPHLWFLITEPDAASFQCVIVNVTTLRSHCDRTLILQKGEHPFIRQPSAVSFADARIVDAREIEAGLRAGNMVPREPCSPDLLRLIQEATLASPHTPNKVVAYCRRAWGKGG